MILTIFCLILTFNSIRLESIPDDNDVDLEFSLEAMSALASAAANTENGSSKAYISSLCTKWFEDQPSDEKIQEIMDSLPPCRPSVPLDENGRFPDRFDSFSIDESCNPNGNSIDQECAFHPGSKACYRSQPPLNNRDQQCCYTADARLLVGPPGGGTLDMSAGFSHVFVDVLPYLLCCRYSNHCDLYYQKRPSDNGSRWKPSSI